MKNNSMIKQHYMSIVMNFDNPNYIDIQKFIDTFNIKGEDLQIFLENYEKWNKEITKYKDYQEKEERKRIKKEYKEIIKKQKEMEKEKEEEIRNKLKNELIIKFIFLNIITTILLYILVYFLIKMR